MLSCTKFMERLYDEDCRRAMEHGAPPPPPMAEHASVCAECARAWEEAEEDARSLPDLLARPSPVALERSLRVRLAEPLSHAPLDLLQRALGWAAVGAAAALTAARALPELAGIASLLLAFAGASIAFVTGTFRAALRG